MANVVVVGSQWGDEGKGKIVDWLSEQADVVVRFQGGHNAGHTLVIDGVTYKLSLLPSGVVRPGKLSVIGNGVVLDPRALIDEIDRLKEQGVDGHAATICASPRTRTLILPLHRSSTSAREKASGKGADRHHRARHRPGLRGQGRPARHPADGSRRPADARRQDRAAARASQCAAPRPRHRRDRAADASTTNSPRSRRKVLPFMDSVWSLLDEKRREGKRILFEGAQGALLDIDHGTYPYVTSSNTVAGAGGDRLRPRAERDRLCARHLPRPTPRGSATGRSRPSCTNDDRRRLGERGREFGTVTGRPRRCGWFDAVLVRQTVRTSGIDGIALTKLDILDGFDEIKVCVGYRLDGREIDYLPASEHAQARVEPIYETIEGWQDATAGRPLLGAICRRRRSNMCAGSRN